MNIRIKALTLLIFLEFTKASSTEGLSAIKLNRISINKGNTLADNTTFVNTRNKKYSSTTSRSNKRWKISRVTNKQYGIINVLWQKTKVFIEHDYSNFTCKATTIKNTSSFRNRIAPKKELTKLPTLQGKMLTSTPSYIEFYYLDQVDDRIKRKYPSGTKLQKLKKGNKTSVNRSNNIKPTISSIIKIRLNEVNKAQHKHLPQPNKTINKAGHGNVYQNKLNKSKRTFVSKTPLLVTTKAKIRNNKQSKKNRPPQTIKMFSKSAPVTAKTMRNERKAYMDKNRPNTTKIVMDMNYAVKSYVVLSSTSTAYDRVKFFEMYDNNTPKWQYHINTNLSNNMVYDNIKERNNRDDKQVLLQHVNENIGHQQDKNKTRYVKKHIQDLFSKESKTQIENNVFKHFSKDDLKISLSTSKVEMPSQKNFSWSRPAVWTEFPFVAVYIYEPLHVHCDAASISPHWLVAAASCLSKYRKEFRGVGLSAFVTFCGDNWRYPQMISYVKRTLIHPLYHPKENIRRLFNAGLVQVVNSMADTCSGWAPASLMSHQYTADEKGSIGTAVGWGLDRYDESYSTATIPRHPLMVYEGRVYSHTCPGSSEYSHGKNTDEVDVRNVYCLLLPPYLAEQNDTVHGALLLIGGKLLALYLKEERRPWGVQSAQYASIWRLLPWLAETAREPDDSFHFEI